MPDSPDGVVAVQRLLLRVALAFVAVVFAGGIFVLSRDDDGSADPAGGLVAGPANAIGPLPGANLGTHVADQKAAAPSGTGRRWAVVSFTTYVTAVDAAARVAPAKPAAYLVAGSGGTPSVVTDLTKWSTAERDAAAQEKADIERLLPTVDQPDFAAEYRRQVERLQKLLASLDPSGAVVFAVLVETDQPQRAVLTARNDIRLVDVGAASKPDLASVRGLRPEEVARAGDPPTRP